MRAISGTWSPAFTLKLLIMLISLQYLKHTSKYPKIVIKLLFKGSVTTTQKYSAYWLMGNFNHKAPVCWRFLSAIIKKNPPKKEGTHVCVQELDISWSQCTRNLMLSPWWTCGRKTAAGNQVLMTFG